MYICYGLEEDNSKDIPEDNPLIAAKMRAAIAEFLHDNDAPYEIYTRMGLVRS